MAHILSYKYQTLIRPAMQSTFRNLLHIFKRFKIASFTNLAGLSIAFFLFLLIAIHVSHEYGFNQAIPHQERVFQLENLRDDGEWDANFARPQLERFREATPGIEAIGLTNNLAYTSFRFGVATGTGPDALSYKEQLERITPGYTEVFGFEILEGSATCLKQPGNLLISEKTARKLFGSESPVGKPVFISEIKGMDNFSFFGINIDSTYTVGGVYRDFPENTRLKNALYIAIPEKEMADDWNMGTYYAYLRMSSPGHATEAVERYVADNRAFLKEFKIEDLRVRSLSDLYFGQQARGDAAPSGNKLRTNMLLCIAILIIGIALVNYTNLSVALAPVRMKSITTQKVLGCPQARLRRYLISESIGLSLLAFCVALGALMLVKNAAWTMTMLGHPVDLGSHTALIGRTFLLTVGAGWLAGVYPAYFITSFPPAMALNGSFTLSPRAKNTRKILVGFQFVISITLIIGAFFVFLQNRYIGNVDLGYTKENTLEVKLSMGTAAAKSELFRDLLLKNPVVREVAFIDFKLTSDEQRPRIGYSYKDEHYYMSWLGVSYNFPALMDVQLLGGRYFRQADEADDNTRAVCLINETAAKEIIARFPAGEIGSIDDLIGTSIQDNGEQVQIVGIFKDVHYESLYKEMQPQGFWTSAKNRYRRLLPATYAYVKIAGSQPEKAIEQIRQVADEINPGYPTEIRFFDEALNELYLKSRQQGILVALLCLAAVILSLAGVFGLVIFESEGREKEIAIRKVLGATIRQILWMFNSSFMKVIAAGFLISAPLAYYGVSEWLQSFAYKTPIYLWVFLIALAIIAFLTLFTVTLQSYRVATSNPAPHLYRG